MSFTREDVALLRDLADEWEHDPTDIADRLRGIAFEIERSFPPRRVYSVTDVHEIVEWMRKKYPIEEARKRARDFATAPNTERGPDFWFAVTNILGGDTTGWREPRNPPHLPKRTRTNA